VAGPDPYEGSFTFEVAATYAGQVSSAELDTEVNINWSIWVTGFKIEAIGIPVSRLKLVSVYFIDDGISWKMVGDFYYTGNEPRNEEDVFTATLYYQYIESAEV
jgi:hypothetical protein